METCRKPVVHTEIHYDLIPSPMMIDGLVKKLTAQDQYSLKVTSDIDKLASKAMERLASASTDRDSVERSESRGNTRTATTLLDQSLSADEINRYNAVLKIKRSGKELRKSSKKSTVINGTRETTNEDSIQSKGDTSYEVLYTSDQVSIYSGPLHNDRSMALSSLADKLANERMMQKSSYNWDQNAICAKIRLGDGAILQNLYPSHSHVRLRNGKIERIDNYASKMMSNKDSYQEVTMIKAYEYNQWARTKPVNQRDLEDGREYPRERLESKSTQPTFDTLRTLNPFSSVSKGKVIADSLVAKFSQPKFLKRLGYIDNIPEMQQKNGINLPLSKEMDKTGNLAEADDENLSSDDEEYQQQEEDDNEEQTSDLPSQVPPFQQTKKQQLAMYKEDSMIGNRKQPKTEKTTPEQEPKILPIPTVHISDINRHKSKDKLRKVRPGSGKTNSSVTGASKYGNNLDRLSTEAPRCTTPNDKKYVRFSQPVCLCPKLSKETLNSFYSPTLQRYLSGAGNFMKCKLHNTPGQQLKSDNIVLRSV